MKNWIAKSQNDCDLWSSIFLLATRLPPEPTETEDGAASPLPKVQWCEYIQCSFKRYGACCCGVQWSSLSLSISVALAVTHQRTSTSLAASRTALTFQCRHPACLDMIYYARSYNSIHSKPKHCLVFSETIHHGRQLLLERGWPSRPECHRFNSHGASQVTCSVTAVGAERINERRDLQWLPKFQLISEGLQYLHCLRYAQMVNKQDEISSWPVPLLWSFWIRLHLQFTSWKVRWLPNRHCHDNLTMVGSRAHFPILYLPVAWRHVRYQTYLITLCTQKYQKDQWLHMARMSRKNVRLLPRLPVCCWV